MSATNRARHGIERFLEKGRLVRLPRRQVDRMGVWRFIVDAAFPDGEVLTEAQVNERLSVYWDDTANLRRYLVDAGLITRTRDGSQYARVVPPTTDSED